MEMQVNADLLKQQRIKRAWSQEHLAQVTGLGLRTIQRIETSGMASNESISAIATVFDMTVAQFVIVNISNKTFSDSSPAYPKHRLWVALASSLIAQVGSPPELTLALACAWLWFMYELIVCLSGKEVFGKSAENG